MSFWERFLKRVLDRIFQDTGPGLSIGKTLVDLHAGRMWAEGRSEGKERDRPLI